MAGLRGNIGWIMGARQSAQGSLATPTVGTTFKSALAGGGMGIARNIGQLAETDSSRDQGVSYVSAISTTGSPEMYTRDDSLGLWLLGALGADAVVGTTNMTHTLTPSNTLPYLSVWRDVSDTLWEAFVDCKVSSIAIAATAGNPLTATVTLQGRSATRLTADPSVSPAIPLSNGYAYNFNDATVTLGGGVTALVSGFTLTINNNVTQQQTDTAVSYDVVEGQRTVELDFDLIFASLDEYNKFHYGSISGTAISPSIYVTSADFKFSNGVNNSIEFALPSIAYSDFPVDVNPAGNPISVAVKAVGQRSSSPIVTSTVKNQVLAY